MLVPVEVSSFGIEPHKNAPMIILREVGAQRSLAVPVDPAEACAIAMHSMQVQTEMPLTIDLVRQVIEELGGELYRVVINDVVEQAFVSCAVIKPSSSVPLKVIGCRVCDAVALAMRCGAPIFVREEVFVKVGLGGNVSAENELRTHIRNIDTVEFGKFVLE